MMRVIQRRSAQIIHLLYLVVQIFLTYKRRLNILHDTKRKFLSIELRAIPLWRLENQMKMVSHQNEKIQPDMKLLHPLAQPLKEPLPIGVVLEQAGLITLPVSHHPAGDMVNSSRILYSQLSCHAQNYRTNSQPLQCLL